MVLEFLWISCILLSFVCFFILLFFLNFFHLCRNNAQLHQLRESEIVQKKLRHLPGAPNVGYIVPRQQQSSSYSHPWQHHWDWFCNRAWILDTNGFDFVEMFGMFWPFKILVWIQIACFPIYLLFFLWFFESDQWYMIRTYVIEIERIWKILKGHGQSVLIYPHLSCKVQTMLEHWPAITSLCVLVSVPCLCRELVWVCLRTLFKPVQLFCWYFFDLFSLFWIRSICQQPGKRRNGYGRVWFRRFTQCWRHLLPGAIWENVIVVDVYLFVFSGVRFFLGTIWCLCAGPCLNHGVSWLLHLQTDQISSLAIIIFGERHCAPPAFPELCGCFPSLFAYHVFGPHTLMPQRALFTRASNSIDICILFHFLWFSNMFDIFWWCLMIFVYVFKCFKWWGYIMKHCKYLRKAPHATNELSLDDFMYFLDFFTYF